MARYANQKTIIIKKRNNAKDFLTIGISEWQLAMRTFKKPATFALYLYLASNAQDYKLDLSKADFEKSTGYSKHAYYDALEELEQTGYLVYSGPQTYFQTSIGLIVPVEEKEQAKEVTLEVAETKPVNKKKVDFDTFFNSIEYGIIPT